MNTENITEDQNNTIQSVLSSENDERSPLAIKVESLEKRLETEKDHRLEDRFIFLIIIMLLRAQFKITIEWFQSKAYRSPVSLQTIGLHV